MRLDDLPLLESLSPIVYHVTPIRKMVEILKTNTFNLVPAFTKGTESEISGGKMYYMSTTRSRLGDYHARDTNLRALIVLNGQKLNQRYSGASVDYWGSPDQRRTMGDEMEDRLLTNQSEIKNFSSYIERVDLLAASGDMYEFHRDKLHYVAEAYRELKKKGIPVRVYFEAKDWRLGTNNFASHEEVVKMFSGPEKRDRFQASDDDDDERIQRIQRMRMAEHRSRREVSTGLSMVLKALRTNNIGSFSDKERRELQDLIRSIRGPMRDYGRIKSDFHNATSDPKARNILREISQEMRKQGFRNLEDMLVSIANEWKDKAYI